MRRTRRSLCSSRWPQSLCPLFSDRLIFLFLLVDLTRDCFLFFPAGFWNVSFIAPQLLSHNCCWILVEVPCWSDCSQSGLLLARDFLVEGFSRRSMQRYRHYGTSYSSSPSLAVPVEKLHAEEEGVEEDTEEEAELLTQEEVQEAGRTDAWVGPVWFGLGSDLVWFGLVRRRRGGAAAGGGGGLADEEGRVACHRGDRWEQLDRTGSEWLYWFGVFGPVWHGSDWFGGSLGSGFLETRLCC